MGRFAHIGTQGHLEELKGTTSLYDPSVYNTKYPITEVEKEIVEQ